MQKIKIVQFISNPHFDDAQYPECEADGGPGAGGEVALVAHAGAQGPHGPGVGVLLGLLATRVHLRPPAPTDDHLLPVRRSVKLHAGVGARYVVGLQRLVREAAEVLDTTVMTL